MTSGEIPVRPTNSDIAAYALYLQRTSTIESQVSSMKTVARHSDMYNPESVKSYLARLNVTTVIPEYPIGLAVLAIFMIIAYGLVRRRIRNNFR